MQSKPTLTNTIYNYKGYTPTSLQLNFLHEYLTTNLKPCAILEKLGKSKTNFNAWRRTEGFNEWFKHSVEQGKSYFLTEAYRSLAQEARNGNVPAIKVLFERFDPEYKPSTRQELDVFAGKRPEDIDGAIERSKERLNGRKQVTNIKADNTQTLTDKEDRGLTPTDKQSEGVQITADNQDTSQDKQQAITDNGTQGEGADIPPC